MSNNKNNFYKYVIIGTGIHGLSTAYHLARKLQETKKGDGKDILVIDKKTIGSGASGIACGVVRNNYSQTPMRKLMQHSVNAWEQDSENYSYHSVGYMQISTEFMAEDIAKIAKEQEEIGYDSVFIEGKKDCERYMKDLFSDWQAQNITAVLHEKKGGYANNMKSLMGLAKKVRAQGVEIIENIEVTGFQTSSSSNQINTVLTAQEKIDCEFVVIAVGPWIKSLWEMLALPKTITIKRNGQTNLMPMWTYWCLQEGTLGIHPDSFKTNNGNTPPVLHVDSDIPLYNSSNQNELCAKEWGIYYKPDFCFQGLQGGAMPYIIDKDADDVAVDPYGVDSSEYTVTESFVNLWLSALSHCQKRFENVAHLYKKEPSGGIGAFTPDNFPVFDVFCENCYIIADSNHGYKMLGVGQLVADEIITNTKSDLLEPFRFSRYRDANLLPTSNSPFPWS